MPRGAVAGCFARPGVTGGFFLSPLALMCVEKKKSRTQKQILVLLTIVKNMDPFYCIQSRSVHGNVTNTTQSFNAEGLA